MFKRMVRAWSPRIPIAPCKRLRWGRQRRVAARGGQATLAESSCDVADPSGSLSDRPVRSDAPCPSKWFSTPPTGVRSLGSSRNVHQAIASCDSAAILTSLLRLAFEGSATLPALFRDEGAVTRIFAALVVYGSRHGMDRHCSGLPPWVTAALAPLESDGFDGGGTLAGPLGQRDLSGICNAVSGRAGWPKAAKAEPMALPSAETEGAVPEPLGVARRVFSYRFAQRVHSALVAQLRYNWAAILAVVTLAPTVADAEMFLDRFRRQDSAPGTGLPIPPSEIGLAVAACLGITPRAANVDALPVVASIEERWLAFWEKRYGPATSIGWLRGSMERRASDSSCCEVLLYCLSRTQRVADFLSVVAQLEEDPGGLMTALTERALGIIVVELDAHHMGRRHRTAPNAAHLRSASSSEPAKRSSLEYHAFAASLLADRARRAYRQVASMRLSPYVINRYLPTVVARLPVFCATVDALLRYGAAVWMARRAGDRWRSELAETRPVEETCGSRVDRALDVAVSGLWLHCLSESSFTHEEVLDALMYDLATACRMLNENAVVASMLPLSLPLEVLMSASPLEARTSGFARLVSSLKDVIMFAGDVAAVAGTSDNGSLRRLADAAVCEAVRALGRCIRQMAAKAPHDSVDANSARGLTSRQRKPKPLPPWRQRMQDAAAVRTHKYEMVRKEVPHAGMVEVLHALLRTGYLVETCEIAGDLVGAGFIDLHFYSLEVLGSLYHAMRAVQWGCVKRVTDRDDVSRVLGVEEVLVRSPTGALIDEVAALYKRRRSVYGEERPQSESSGLPPAAADECASLVTLPTALVPWKAQPIYQAFQCRSYTAAGGALVIDRSFANWVRRAVVSTATVAPRCGRTVGVAR